jgi:hypothetical protein
VTQRLRLLLRTPGRAEGSHGGYQVGDKGQKGHTTYASISNGWNGGKCKTGGLDIQGVRQEGLCEGMVMTVKGALKVNISGYQQKPNTRLRVTDSESQSRSETGVIKYLATELS